MPLSPIEWVVILTSLTSGTLAALGLGGYFYFRERTDRQQRRRRQKQHLARLQRLSAKLLNALDHLLSGDTPQETILYQRFSAGGGDYYTDIRTDMVETLGRAQSALTAAFDLHQKLVESPDQPERSLNQQIWDWEMLYATLVGRSEQISQLTADEITTLLDPLLAGPAEPEPNELVEQLAELRRELAGQPLKIKYQQLYADHLEPQGILDYVHHLKTQLARLPERHKQEAPYWLAEARYRRQQAEAEIPSFLPELYRYITDQTDSPEQPAVAQTKADLLANIDQRLAQAEAAQTQGRFLEVIEQAYDIWQDVDTLRTFVRAINDHGRQRARLEAITAQGYRPPNLTADLAEIKADIQTIVRHLRNGSYASVVGPWITELTTDSQRAVAATEAWQELHQQNVAKLDHLRQQLGRLSQWQEQEVEPVWQQFQEDYPEPNWVDLAAAMTQAQQTSRKLNQEIMAQIDSLNSLELQNFTEAERLLAYATTDLAQLEQQFQGVVDRRAELSLAEARLAEALRLTEADLARAETRRNQEDNKIGPDVDQLIEQARQHLNQARQLGQAGEFIAALDQQTAARQLASTAYVTAEAQVREINARQARLAQLVEQAKSKIAHCLSEASDLAAVVQTISTSRLARQLQARVTEAEQARLAATTLEDQALAEALQEAIELYQAIHQQTDWVLQQLALDQAEYDALLNQTLAGIAEAQEAIRRARQAVAQADASGAGQHALQRAQGALPPVEDTPQATKAALARMQQQAQEAVEYAQLAERQARWQSRLAEARPEQLPVRSSRLRRLKDKMSEETQTLTS